MKIMFLGTCAYDYSPRLEGDLKDKFDLDARRSSSMLLDGTMLVDCGTHTINSLDIAKIPYEQITDLVITHLHCDHFDEKNIEALAKNRHTSLRLWVREDASLDEIPNVEINRMRLYVPSELPNGVRVIGMLANHDESAYPQHLFIEKDGKRIFYGCDGAWLLNQTYYYLNGKRLDLAVLDCTMGDYDGDYRIGEHNSIPMLRVMLPSLKAVSITDEHTKVYFSHLAPSLHAPHEKTVEIAKKLGAFVAHDGLEIEL